MSRPVKRMMMEAYRQQFGEMDQALAVALDGVPANANNRMRADLGGKGIDVRVVKTSLARQALADTPLAPLRDVIQGPTALVYGADSVVTVTREIMGWARRLDGLQLRGAALEGELFGPDDLETLSNYPTKAEAQGQSVQVVLSPGQRLAGAVHGPGSQIASILKTIQERLENGEPVKQAG